MSTNATTSQGVRIQRGDGGGSEVFTTIAEIINFTGPTESAKQIEVTSVDSTAHEYISGLLDSGEINVTGNFVGSNAQQQGLRADMLNRVKRNFKVLLTDDPTTPTQFAFAAIVTKFEIKGAVDKQLEFQCSLKISAPAVPTYKT